MNESEGCRCARRWRSRGFGIRHFLDVPVSARTPSKLPTTRSPERLGRARSNSPRPLSGGIPLGTVAVPRLMSPTNASLTEAYSRAGGVGVGSSKGDGGRTRVSGRSTGGPGRGCGGGDVLAHPDMTMNQIQRRRGLTPRSPLPPSGGRPPRVVSGCVLVPRPPAAHLPAPIRWTRSTPPAPAA
jgi:hypothetical protein